MYQTLFDSNFADCDYEKYKCTKRFLIQTLQWKWKQRKLEDLQSSTNNLKYEENTIDIRSLLNFILYPLASFILSKQAVIYPLNSYGDYFVSFHFTSSFEENSI